MGESVCWQRHQRWVYGKLIQGPEPRSWVLQGHDKSLVTELGLLMDDRQLERGLGQVLHLRNVSLRGIICGSLSGLRSA